MKILYAIQGTGNGHLARATDIVPILKEMAETHVLVSGTKGDIKLPFPVDYKFRGISFVLGRTGKVSMLKTALHVNLFQFIRDIFRLTVRDYDLVICDFEPVSAWASRLKRVTCVGVSHQNAVLHPLAPKPSHSDLLGKLVLKFYAPAKFRYGFHFRQLDEYNFTPVIRRSIRDAIPVRGGHYTVYLPAYGDDEIIAALKAFPNVKWEIFSKMCRQCYTFDNVIIEPVSLQRFTESFISCIGLLCNAGFEAPAEALFMGKKLCVIPTGKQFEQECNAAFLESMGVPVLKSLRQASLLETWLSDERIVNVAYPDITQKIFRDIIERFSKKC